MKAKPNSEAVKVIFRKWPKSEGGGVLALFPELPHDYTGYHCTSYEHTGQHGGADATGCIRRTKPATPAEYAALKRELESAPFHYVLRVVSRIPRNALEIRRAEIAAKRERAEEYRARLRV